MNETLFAQLNCQVDFVSLPNPFCQIAGSIFHNPLQQLTKLPTPVCQNCRVHIISGEPPECTLKLPNFKQTALFHVYSICAAFKKLSKPRSKRSPHSFSCFYLMFKSKTFLPTPTKKGRENKSYPSSPTIYEVAIWKRCWLSDLIVCCQSSQIPR